MQEIQVRKEVMDFAIEMEKKLQANEHRGGWENCSLDFLTLRLREELIELFEAMRLYHMFPSEDTRSRVIDETADVANFNMMIQDLVKKGLGGR